MEVRARLRVLLRTLAGYARDSIGMIPPRDLTVTRIGVSEARIRSYWKANGHLPASLSDLPILEGRDNSTIDAHGRPILYQITGATTVTLSSAGGAGLHEDIVVSFDAAQEEWGNYSASREPR